MSARLAFGLVAVFCLAGITACNKSPATTSETPAPAASISAEPAKTPAVVEVPESPVAGDTFILDTAVKSTDTLASLRTQFGETNVIEGELPGAEGETAQGWIIFPKDPEKKLMIYTDESNSRPGTLMVDEANSKWQLSNSIKLGTDSTTLQNLNKKPFTFYGFYWDYGGVITEWNGGELGKQTPGGAHISIHVCPPEDAKLPDNYLSGDGTFDSDNALAIKFPPVVCKLGVYFPVEEKK